MVETTKQFFMNLDLESDERYDMGRFMEFVGDNYDPLTSNLISEVKKLTLGGKYIITGEDEKPDLLSYRIYGSTQYWWLLLMYNGFSSYKGYKTGETITFPLLQDLEDLYFGLNVKQSKQDKE